MRAWLIVSTALLVPAFAAAQPAYRPGDRPVVVELFTSQGCSSCPPADAEVARLARTRPDLLPLTFHVTYWNRLGWHDPFSFDGATERQRRYVALGASPEVYTPAMVVDGRLNAVGSDRAAVDHALTQAAQDRQTDAPVSVRRHPAGLTVSVGAGEGGAVVLLVGYDRLHRTAVGRGENGGRTLEEANVVRSLSVLGPWSGAAASFAVPLPAGEEAAVLLQRADGRVVGAATTRETSPGS